MIEFLTFLVGFIASKFSYIKNKRYVVRRGYNVNGVRCLQVFDRLSSEVRMSVHAIRVGKRGYQYSVYFKFNRWHDPEYGSSIERVFLKAKLTCILFGYDKGIFDVYLSEEDEKWLNDVAGY